MPSIIDFLDTSPTIEEVDKKITDLHNAIHILEQYRNARLTIISRLPPEVLSNIFQRTALGESGQAYSRWLPVSQVCQSWRYIALNTPRMWCYINDGTRVELTKLFLERAKSAPLYLSQRGDYNHETAKLLFKHHAARLKEIDTTLPSSQAPLADFAPTMFPSLERLSLFVRGRSSEGSRIVKFASDTTGRTFLPLQHLKLGNCGVNFQGLYFTQLISLNIHLSPWLQTPVHIPVAHLLAAINRMESLESLTLVNALDPLGRIPKDTRGRILFPRLTRIFIKASAASSLAIFSHIACPAIQSITASVDEVIAVDEAVPMARAFCSLIPSSPSSWKTELHVDRAMQGRYKTIIVISPGPIVQVDKTPPLFRLFVLSPTHYATSTSLFSFFSSTKPIIGLRRLHMPGPGDTSLRDFMRALVGAEELHIEDFETLLSILADAPNKILGARVGSFALPSLKCIDITEVQRIKYKTRSLKKLKKLLESRKAFGAGIKVLRYGERQPEFFNQDDLALLKSEIKTVEMLPIGRRKNIMDPCGMGFEGVPYFYCSL